ncbi:restriction endonuclease subunit S [Nostoc sp. NMS9]|uniref:restriction endonuclease subunit S n=1 Tax=Nostoc sp. NMS9 TaxID=2815393 RepID=UPI0025D1D1DD|nr:restriction endonuclease subunit S [Nostoc sp. NMS9]MBN3944563.1 restriction endonuclease subunit S [Nostoc sp. NMS9]
MKSELFRKGWKNITLGKILTFQRGFDITKRQLQPGEYDVIFSSGLGGKHNEYKVKAPGVVIGRKGTLGTVFFAKSNFWATDTTLWVKDFHGNDEKFAYYFLQTLHLEQYDCGSANPTLNRNHIHELPISYPSLPTQKKIAAILSAYDDLIENNTRRIKILEEMAQTLYHEWFVKFRFPGQEHTKMVDSELGLIPEGWELKQLEQVADINLSSIKSGNAPEEIKYVDISSVNTGQINNIETIAFVEASSRARRVVKHGDIIWSTVRPNRRSYSLIINPIQNLIVSTGFAVITAKKIPYTYLYHALTTDNFVDYLTNNATGSAYPAVNTADFKNAELIIPPHELLNQFHKFCADILSQKQNFHSKNLNLRKTRDLLLPKLISGEIDVEHLKITTEDIAA